MGCALTWWTGGLCRDTCEGVFGEGRFVHPEKGRPAERLPTLARVCADVQEKKALGGEETPYVTP